MKDFRKMSVENFCSELGISPEELVLVLLKQRLQRVSSLVQTGKRTRKERASGAETKKTKGETKRGRPKASSKRSTKKKIVNTRTAAGRVAYDEAVLAFLKKAKAPMSAEEVRGACGGNPDQCRKSMARLIEASTVSYEGVAQGMKYFAC